MKKIFLWMLALTTIFQMASAATICGVTSNEDLIIRDGSNNKLLGIDSSGDVIIYSDSVTTSTTPSTTGVLDIRTGSTLHSTFTSTQADIRGSIVVGSTPSLAGLDLVFRGGSSSNVMAVFDESSNNFYIPGNAAYDGYDSGCTSDGFYCNGNTREDRDYYCNMGSQACTYNVDSSTNCLTQCSGEQPGNGCSGGSCTYSSACNTGASDTDGGQVYGTAGTCTDYTGCSSGSCTDDGGTADSCGAGNVLTEYYTSAGSCSSTTYDCDNDDVSSSDSDGGSSDYTTQGTCSVGTNYACSSGACSSSSGSGGGTDSCGAGNVLTEYGTSGTFDCTTNTYDCDNDDVSSSDSDGGDDKFNRGTCSVGTNHACSGGACGSSGSGSGGGTDSCADGDTVTEYMTSGTFDCTNANRGCGQGYSCAAGTSGECNDCDSDNDGYCPSNDSPNDCYDSNSNAYPGQTFYSTTDRGDGSFDYNCDSTEEKQYRTSPSCANQFDSCSFDCYGYYFDSGNPPCGQSGSYNTQTTGCDGAVSRTQGCR